MVNHARILVFLLRAMALAEFLAVGAVFLPVSWMAGVHGRLGLGDFPDAPICGYLARHLSAMYVVHGGFIWLASLDLRRHAGLIRYLAVSGMAFSLYITVLDVRAGFPWYWTFGEGPALTVLSVIFLLLLRKAVR